MCCSHPYYIYIASESHDHWRQNDNTLWQDEHHNVNFNSVGLKIERGRRGGHKHVYTEWRVGSDRYSVSVCVGLKAQTAASTVTADHLGVIFF